MRIVPSLIWTLGNGSNEAVDHRLLPLLEAIAASASLAAAVVDCGISYRAGWGLLRDYRQKLGVGLVRLERGRGASLTPAGERLVGAHRVAVGRLAGVLPGLGVDVGPSSRQEPPTRALRLGVAASHDLALAALSDALRGDGLSLELSFMGSLHALEEFAGNRADVAGFHVPIAGYPALDLKPFLRCLRGRLDRLIRFVDRDQGLILPQGNPAHVKGFRDIAAKGLRLVNRQRGSGTRLLIDQMLVAGGIDSTLINGYRTEEFTHAAVAATVASGGADAGFGLRAAAAEYQLTFVPLVRERYFLAVRVRDLESAAVARLLAALRSTTFSRLVRPLGGYQTTGAGSVVGKDALGAAGQA